MMTTPTLTGHPTLYRDPDAGNAPFGAAEKWSRRYSALFITGISALSWLFVASPFVIWS
jgi:hypothetical protein